MSRPPRTHDNHAPHDRHAAGQGANVSEAASGTTGNVLPFPESRSVKAPARHRAALEDLAYSALLMVSAHRREA